MAGPTYGSQLIQRAVRVTVDTIQINAVSSTGAQEPGALSVKFSVKRDIKAKPNTVDLQIRNLNADHRLALQQMGAATVQIDAGYVGATSTIFLGDLRTTYSAKEGADWVTSLSAGDGEKAHSTARVAKAFRKNTDVGTVLKALVTALGVSKGNTDQAISQLRGGGFAGLFSMGTVLCGSASREMTRLVASVGYTWSIQNGALQLLPIGQALAGTAILISETSGMIGSPSVDKDGTVSVRTLMVPDLFPGRKIVVNAHEISGQFVAQETSHSGDTQGNDWYIDTKGKPY